MNWNIFCTDVLRNGGCTTSYVYLGTTEGMLGEKDKGGKSATLSNFEVSTITNSNGSNFQFRDEEYRFSEAKDAIFCYESSTKWLAFGRTSRYVLIVCGSSSNSSKVKDQCQKAVDYGLSSIEQMME
ncbi:uncharacterized protein LOC143453100 [Clavelina lepadiformis]|uniref:Profilin n=1 Tax=Clavelina lepadiformis TaxID=159417 RepID=A0ABP0GJV6_CLALP